MAAEIGGVFAEVNVTSEEQVDAGFEKSRAGRNGYFNGEDIRLDGATRMSPR